jgi:hypothetical protein
MKTDVHLCQYVADFFSEWEMLQTNFVEKIKTYILGWLTCFPKIVPLWNNVEKCFGVGEATDDGTEHSLCMLGN